jgi:hypothetical protein
MKAPKKTAKQKKAAVVTRVKANIKRGGITAKPLAKALDAHANGKTCGDLPAAKKVNLLDSKTPEAIVAVRADRARHIALRYYRGNSWTEAIVIGLGGAVDTIRIGNQEFDERFCFDEVKGSADEFEAAEKLLGIAKRTHGSNSAKAVELLKEIVAIKREALQAKGQKGRETVKLVIDPVRLKAAAARGTAQDAVTADGTRTPVRTRGSGIGAFCVNMIKDLKSTDEILKAIRAQFPDAKTSAASIAWYRNDLRQKGELPKA